MFVFCIFANDWAIIASAEAPLTLLANNIALAIIQNVQKLAGGKNIERNNGNAYWNSGRFPVFFL